MFSAVTSWAAIATGSTVSWGIAPWPPLPTTVTSNMSAAASSGSGQHGHLAGVEDRHQVGTDDDVDPVHHAGRDELLSAAGRKLLRVLEDQAHLPCQVGAVLRRACARRRAASPCARRARTRASRRAGSRRSRRRSPRRSAARRCRPGPRSSGRGGRRRSARRRSSQWAARARGRSRGASRRSTRRSRARGTRARDARGGGGARRPSSGSSAAAAATAYHDASSGRGEGSGARARDDPPGRGARGQRRWTGRE